MKKNRAFDSLSVTLGVGLEDGTGAQAPLK